MNSVSTVKNGAVCADLQNDQLVRCLDQSDMEVGLAHAKDAFMLSGRFSRGSV